MYKFIFHWLISWIPDYHYKNLILHLLNFQITNLSILNCKLQSFTFKKVCPLISEAKVSKRFLDQLGIIFKHSTSMTHSDMSKLSIHSKFLKNSRLIEYFTFNFINNILLLIFFFFTSVFFGYCNLCLNRNHYLGSLACFKCGYNI